MAAPFSDKRIPRGRRVTALGQHIRYNCTCTQLKVVVKVHEDDSAKERKNVDQIRTHSWKIIVAIAKCS